MAGSSQDNSQWLSVTEETLFLHDGLIRVTDLVELPHDVSSVSDHEVVTFDSKSPEELSEKLKTVCGTQNNAYTRLLEYRLNALRGLWNAQRQIAIEEQNERNISTHEETIQLLKKQGLWKEPEQASFSTRVSLLLVLPLLQSQSKVDAELCGVTAQLLLNCLRDCAPLSLSKEPADCLNGIEQLLCGWLEEGSKAGNVEVAQMETAASALVALACARGHPKTFIHTIHLLQNLSPLGYLPVADILQKLLSVEGGQAQPSAVLGSKHIVCWGVEDMLGTSDKDTQEREKDKDAVDPSRSITCDGKFLYTTSSTGKGIAKIGTGLHGTLRGYIYARNPDIGPGMLAYGNGQLLHRPTSYDQEKESKNFAQHIDSCTLLPISVIPLPEQYDDPSLSGGVTTTVGFTSDSMTFYWIWCPGSLNDKSSKGQSVNLEAFKYNPDSNEVLPMKPSRSLQRKDENTGKSINETLLSRLRPYRSAASAHATLVALTGGDPLPGRKEEQNVNTSIGVPVKTLVRTPVYCDGTTVVWLNPIPGSNNSSAARSLFGSGGALGGLRTLANNVCFNLSDGQYNTRSDLIDAPTCALARGASVLGLGICYDAFNNMIWTFTNDWVDQFYNPGHQASHLVLTRLGIDPNDKNETPEDNALSSNDVIRKLLQHVGCMCIHQINNDLLHTPLGSYILQQDHVDLMYMERVCDILEKAVAEGDSGIIRCSLIVFQLMFKLNLFKRDREKEVQLVERTSQLVWKVLMNKEMEESIQKESCTLLSFGLKVFYPTPADRNNLLYNLLTEDKGNAGLEHLRDLILVDLADQLRSQALDSAEVKNARLTGELIQLILKFAVKESCVLLRQCQSKDRSKFDEILSVVPLASPSLQYFMALQCHLLRSAVLYKTEDAEEGNKKEEKPKEKLEEIQVALLNYASMVLGGAYEVLEVLLETCNSIINNRTSDLEYRLQGLERVCKATILGHLLPVLITAMNHYNLRCLSMADSLMSQLVQLVVLTSQAALLMKSQVQAIGQEEDLDVSTDSDGGELVLIEPTLSAESLENMEEEEQGFLAGLKIPAPWATGKTLESIHPVRDNYKYKETVTIPGARCLYLRFDPRCSSQYDYDKLVLYAGPTTNSRKVSEYGGNTMGYGSRSVLGAGWPKDLVKVDGDTVTLSFEMRSGREHNTPDKAMWGFMVTVRAQESTEEVSSGLPFLADLALGLSVLGCTMLHLLYQGPEKTKDETACEHLLKSKLLQRCVWRQEGPSSPIKRRFLPCDTSIAIPEGIELDINEQQKPSSTVYTLARIKLPADIVTRLRELSGKSPPHIRPSIRQVLQPEVLEEAILSATVKHLGLENTIHQLVTLQEQQNDEYWLLQDIMSELFKKIDSLARQLQSVSELEQKWEMEVEEIRQGLQKPEAAFFADYYLVESKTKELAMLCYIKDIQFDGTNAEAAVNALREKLEASVASDKSEEAQEKMPKTKALVAGLLERLSLLLQVNIPPDPKKPALLRNLSLVPETSSPQMVNAMIRSDTDIVKTSPPYGRSHSAPSEVLDDSVIEIVKLQRKRHAHKKTASILQDLVEDDSKDKPPYVVLIDLLFSFMGSNPEQAVSCESFLAAAKVRWKRGQTRRQALVHMRELLTAASRVGGATHLVAAVTSVLQHGPRISELTCGGMVNQVRDAFAETMTAVVQLAARYPIACCNSIGLLCIIPYTRAEEKCLVRCGLVHLLDKLCSLSNCRGDTSSTDSQSTRQKVSAMAWAGFQVLANRCVMWEQEEGMYPDELEHSGLARQVSVLLTNHLARATEGSGNEAAGNEALQEVLSLLNNLSRSRMGRAILSQPACVSKLLSLLLDQRPSPKLVLIILQLCRVALPLMSADDCENVELSTWGRNLPAALVDDDDASSIKITSLLLAKLGDFIVPGGNVTTFSHQPSLDGSGARGASGHDRDKRDDADMQDGRLSVFVHKRDDQSSHEVIQPLLSSDSRPFRLGGGANMERVVKMDREMSRTGKAEITTEEASSALRKAAKWAQMGLIVSTGPPVDSQAPETAAVDKKKQAFEVTCKEKNSELARTDPVRPFISGQVANSMAAEVIALLHCLLTAPETHTAQVWATAVRKVLTNALEYLPSLINSVENIGSPRFNQHEIMDMAKQANAALAALGGFTETIKPGCEVEITGAGIEHCTGTVLSVSEETGLAAVTMAPLPSEDSDNPARYGDTVSVPVRRLKPPRNEPLPLHQLSMTDAIVAAVQCLLLPQNTSSSPLSQALPMHGDGNSLANQSCRVVAEIRTRACMVLANYLRDITFTSSFIQHSSAAIDILKSLSKDCGSGDRKQVIESQCDRLRMLYRDCAKPPLPPNKAEVKNNKEITWDTSRSFPTVRSCMFTQGQTTVNFLGDPSAGSGLPRGVFIYANQPVPYLAPSFYWEIEICCVGDPQEESGPTISFGFAPAAEKKDGAWTNPVGTCLFHNNGRAVHYNGSSLLQWKSVRLDVTLNAADVAGCGWERTEESAPLPGQQVKGQVFFTFNGRRLPATMDDVSSGMWPVVHIQKRNTKIKANFGAKPFAYAEGREHRDAADECSDISREIQEMFEVLPFHITSDSDSETQTTTGTATPDSSAEVGSPPGPPCRLGAAPKASREYNTESSLNFKLLPSYDNFTFTGPDSRTQQANHDDESDIEDSQDDQSTEDHYALLVKAWEQKVFPTIRRRFRNEAERKDGLEQIKGALQLGMTDIARQTVEFLYEENGGMPRDLHLPTIDDIKEELAKFSIERVHRGTTVVIKKPEDGLSGQILPKWAIRGMLKTLGLTGVVLDVDQPNELVQVETYLRSEGVLVRFWYPLSILERPPQGFRKTSIVGQQPLDTSNILIHRELLRVEAQLTRAYCRAALLELINQCNSTAMEALSCTTSLSGMAASAAVLQELDVENLQLLSNELLSPPQAHGCIVATSLLTSTSPRQCLSANTCALSDVFYHNPMKLKEELKIAISRAASQGEDYLIELTNQLCVCLQISPEMFPVEEFLVTEVKTSTDVYFPGASFLVISCKRDPKVSKKESSPYKSPWARIFTYTGHRIKKNGQSIKQEVISYPRDTTSTSNTNDQYAPVIISADRVHVRVGVSPPPGVILTIHALPPQFPLSMAYMETLLSQRKTGGGGGSTSRGEVKDTSKETDGSLSKWNFEEVSITPCALQNVIELLGSYLLRTDIPAVIKESIFHILAQALRVWRQSHEEEVEPILFPVKTNLSGSLGALLQLQTELKKVYEEESASFPTGTTASGAGMGLGIGDQGRFTTYFQALLEACLAIAEVSSPTVGPLDPAASKSLTSPPSKAKSAAPPSPMSSSKRKKLKAKRDRDRERAGARFASSPRTSESDSGLPLSPAASETPSSSETSVSPASSSTSVGTTTSTSNSSMNKPEDMLWFHRALTMSQILRHLTSGEKQGEVVTSDAVADAFNTLINPSAHSRLMVIAGIPSSLDTGLAFQTILKICNVNGGLFKNEILLPVKEILINQETEDGKKNADQGSSKSAAAQPGGAGTAGVEGTSTKTQSEKDEVPSTTEPTEVLKAKTLKGYAVVELRSKAKFESVRKAIYKNKVFLQVLNFDPDDMVDMPEDLLSISPVNQSLFADPQGNDALDEYFQSKLVTGQDLTDGAIGALTDIYHSCYIAVQKLSPEETKTESGFICLTKDQIMMQTPGNLLHPFFTNVRPPKKSLSEQVTYALRHYGMFKMVDKEEPSIPPEKGKGKTGRRSSKTSKEKLAMGTTSSGKTSPREKKKAKEASEKPSKEEGTPESSSKQTKEAPKDEDKLLTLNGFLQFVLEKSRQDARSVCKSLLSCGYDLHFERCSCIDLVQADQMSKEWTLDMDFALVQHVNNLCWHLAVAPSRLHPHEIYLSEEDLSNASYSCLQGIPLESIRLRFALLQSLNNSLETFFLPLVDLRPHKSYSCSTAALLTKARGLVFHDTKMTFLNRVLNVTAKRKPDQAAPEIILDPLENVGGERRDVYQYQLCQAFRQLSQVLSTQLCVRIAAGGDPTYAFNVKFTGEEVHGTSGSFRHFLCQVARELETPALQMLMLCPSTAGSRNKGKYIMSPGGMSYPMEKLLEFVGQLFGITIRADIPLGLDLLSVFWKNLVAIPLDPATDLQEADILTYNYIKKFDTVESDSELQVLFAETYPRLTYTSLSGDEEELIPNGRNTFVTWDNRHQYVDAIRQYRMKELSCESKVTAFTAGLASIVPVQLLSIMTPHDMEVRTCGLPFVDLDFLKAHTMYQVGLMESDPHIEYFWAALESFSQDELGKFVRFSCNQERIPMTCPCREGTNDSVHVPPYPMKIAPPDGPGTPDSRHIRVETCMFMIKLPQYSSYQITRQRLLYAINCREDPLSG
ncbi:probable E3 ubiquitin-protein ligase HECTD4 isoform X2 [Lingula anatina]|uniref:Probable E3 ubiquitin-protein ligase HECTD4 isoform X2 n=1 Tax=Lingula anatina TaxID=7574 RepID=A0A1S3H4G4_LINAN|nr:probable E3 ubiquitin-protein ligase HECTD4 isoform X2 [Lingula anatina]|eukprot:XP_013380029.1 probable E3 ubiquitin-protein ligase HECTD4 isoform X2 [Lingula anatina]